MRAYTAYQGSDCVAAYQRIPTTDIINMADIETKKPVSAMSRRILKMEETLLCFGEVNSGKWNTKSHLGPSFAVFPLYHFPKL